MDRVAKIKARLLVVAILAVILISIIWAFVTYEKVAYAIIVAVFGFFGFYLSELAKQVIRAKHAAYQGWAYITNLRYSNALEPSIASIGAFAKDWLRARNELFEKLPENAKRNVDYTIVDKEFKEKIYQQVAQPKYLAERAAYFESQRKLPGKVEWNLKQSETNGTNLSTRQHVALVV